jgi:hypothetical protein
MARATGLEPATPGVTGRYSNRLSYARAISSSRHVATTVSPQQQGGRDTPVRYSGQAKGCDLLHLAPCDCQCGRPANRTDGGNSIGSLDHLRDHFVQVVTHSTFELSKSGKWEMVGAEGLEPPTLSV